MLFNLFRKYKNKDTFIVLFRTCKSGDDVEHYYNIKEILGVTDSKFTANRIAFDFANAFEAVLAENGDTYSRSTDLERGRIILTSTLDNGTMMDEVISIEKYTKE